MPRSDIDIVLNRIDDLAKEVEVFVPLTNRNIQFRADLAGLLVVAIAASYESCVKETLVNYASRHHERFAVFAQNQFAKLSSRVRINDLNRYAGACDPSINQKFNRIIKARKANLVGRLGKDFTKSYDQILDWRHDFAHQGLRNTTVEEALATHTFAKRVMYAFNDAFD